MSVSQIYPGRVSNSLTARRMLEAINSNQFTISQLQMQLATGQKFQLPSEAPTAATQTLMLQKLDERQAAFAESVQTNQGFLAMTDQSLATISDAISQARGLAQAAAGNQVTPQEREGLALEVAGLIQSVIQAANTQYSGRYLFAGSATGQAPFSMTSTGNVRYQGNSQVLGGLADFGLIINTGVDGAAGLGATTSPEWSDNNPALTSGTSLSQLYNGLGVTPGTVRVTVDDGTNVVQKDVDLSSARTINDVKLQLEHAFAGELTGITVEIDPVSLSGLRITPAAGTVEIRDLTGSSTARDLGIVSGPAGVVQGRDLDPSVGLFTPVAALNGGAGIGATAGFGLEIVNGGQTTVVDLDGVSTVQDLLNRITSADPNVMAGISPDGRGIVVSSRLSGSNFSIGEHGGDNATQLGIRTFTASSRIDDLNLGEGIPRDAVSPLQITRRDGSTVEVDVREALTVQDVMNAINAVDPGVLTARLNEFGNGISLQDSSGAGPLTVTTNSISTALGLNGTDNGGAAGTLVGQDVHPRQPGGALNLLVNLERAIRSGDNAELGRIASGLEAEAARFAVVRGNVGIQQRQLEGMSNILADRHVDLQGQLETLFNVDYAEVITQFTTQQQALQAYLSVAGQTQKLTVLDYL